MQAAIAQARIAEQNGDIPIGAVITLNDEIIAEAYNRVELDKNPTAHCEIEAIRIASSKLGLKRLSGCDLYVTLEPCSMCAGAIVLARFDSLIFGAYDNKTGACGSLYNIPQDSRLNHNCMVIGGFMEEQCSRLLKSFFKKLRNKI
jgi:tRNA(adenine34) deaminase